MMQFALSDSKMSPSAIAELLVYHSLSCLNIVHKRSGGDTWGIADNIWSNDSWLHGTLDEDDQNHNCYG